MAFDEVKIETVYLEENKSSHFRAVRDSIRIYSLILKYLLASIASAVIDESAFFLFKSLFGAAASILFIPTTFVAAFLARAVSSFVNFLINAKVVFGDRVNKKTLAKYYSLALFQIVVSAAIVFLLEHLLSVTSPILSTTIKTVVDTLLFFFSFRVQHKWVFSDGKQ